MLRILMAGALCWTIALATTAEAGVAVSVGQPGFYGQIVLGDAYPVPQVVYPQPVIIQPPPVAVVQPPMYLHVPPGHMKRWARYCGGYGACGRQVYFVQDGWYQNVYVPHYRAHPGPPGPGPGWDHWHDGPPGPGGRPGGPGRGHGHDRD
ncbi:hypothetical protein Q9292_08090 [Methylophilus sp. VKM B-3414]|jgi:hypothetical protein|uniref:hypothetical protein n=1 Tax=Methylophilus sp. VKM B-3414 TaxID=3076121 RepID=UPI0028C8B1CA|nr:hypothetical protein [Methylophilus sp. VKM B-3414]MDT7849566.1 hypothetical protein [Methylophilus sp. VKM B-3414]